ncbi:helix-turn-helix transcriptional regulator [Aerococcaceae bacterium zg-BR22]|uniref:helix-turn-helix domain-containing protein n=1 Tax=Aerococcaceae bacterium zg-1292 TaxID=2774330 RepID=UPI0040638246|nr:helix-turn-helix transcriptional regulator [Aerococcaceae bacterium zg-BR22]
MLDYNKKIKELRLQQNMTQSDLAEGITNQSIISKIEKGLLSPDIELLQQICNRLNISLTTLLNDDNSYLTISTDYIESLLDKRDYVNLEIYLSTLNTSSLSPNHSNYLEWLNLIVRLTCYKEIEPVIDKATQLINTLSINNNKFNIELKINLFLLIAIAYEKLDDFYQSKNVLIEAYSYSQLPIVEWKLNHKILYALTRVYYKLEQYEESYQFGLDALEITASNNSLLYLEDILLALAHASYRLDMLEESKEYINKAELIAQLKLNDRNLKQVHLFRNKNLKK